MKDKKVRKVVDKAVAKLVENQMTKIVDKLGIKEEFIQTSACIALNLMMQKVCEVITEEAIRALKKE